MPQLELPLWFITEQRASSPPDHPACDDAEAIIAFSSFPKLTEYWAASTGGRYKVIMASDRDALIGVIADAHSNGQESVCVNPKPDGSDGVHISLGELIALVGRLEPRGE